MDLTFVKCSTCQTMQYAPRDVVDKQAHVECVECGAWFKGNPMENDVIASEAVFGFAAWLTTRRKPVLLGAEHDAAPAAELADQWCKANHLPEPRERAYPKNITHPKETA